MLDVIPVTAPDDSDNGAGMTRLINLGSGIDSTLINARGYPHDRIIGLIIGSSDE